MPLAMKLTRPEKTMWPYRHHIDWDARVILSDTAASTVDVQR
jgi:hypothetical protein